MFFNIILVFTGTFDWFNAFLLNKSIYLNVGMHVIQILKYLKKIYILLLIYQCTFFLIVWKKKQKLFKIRKESAK